MIFATCRHAEVLVIGAGPAGLAAATAAAHAGANVIVLDGNPYPGGQIWRSSTATREKRKDTAQNRLFQDLHATDVQVLCGRQVIDSPRPGTLTAFVEQSATTETYTWDRLILATGARERFIPFPGWTTPGVFGAGGLQALVKGGYSVEGKRVVIAGTGPLLLAVASHLQQHGANVVAVAEQASLGAMLKFTATLWSHPSKLLQGLGYRAALSTSSYRTGCWPIAAEGTDKLMAVCFTNGTQTWSEPCDLLGCAFHLVPDTELAALIGCELRDDFIAVNVAQETSIKNVYCAGEPTGIAGLDAALVEGRIAGLMAAGKPGAAAALYKRRDRERAFGLGLDQAFALRSELRTLAQPSTIICRCEDVSYAQLETQPSWTDAKLQTRCGMGPCQGRICGSAVQLLFGWRNTSIRPPLFPVPLSTLISTSTPSSPSQETL